MTSNRTSMPLACAVAAAILVSAAPVTASGPVIARLQGQGTSGGAPQQPDDLVGRLRIEGAPEGARVTVDHLPLSREELSLPYPLTAGKHVVEVSAPGYVTKTAEIDIAAGGVAVFDAALAPVPAVAEEDVTAAAEPVPWWPAAVTGGMAAAAAITAVVAGVDGAVTQSTLDGLYAGLENTEANQGPYSPHIYAASKLPSGVEVNRVALQRAALRNDAIIVVAAGSIALVAGAATAAFATRWALADDEGEP